MKRMKAKKAVGRTTKVYVSNYTGITKTGNWAEEMLIQDTGGYKEPKSKKGDVVTPIDGDTFTTTEVKAPTKNVDIYRKSYTCNQSRGISLNILAVNVCQLRMFDCDYIILSPAEVLTRVLGGLGQHTPDSFICANLSVKPSDVKEHGCTRAEVKSKIAEVYNDFINSESYELVKWEVGSRKRLYDKVIADNKALHSILVANKRDKK